MIWPVAYLSAHHATAQSLHSTSACPNTVRVALSCLSGGLPIAAQDVLDHDPHLGQHVLLQRPVDGDLFLGQPTVP